MWSTGQKTVTYRAFEKNLYFLVFNRPEPVTYGALKKACIFFVVYRSKAGFEKTCIFFVFYRPESP